MDPFTIAASVAKITSSCLVTGKAIYDLSCKYQDAPRNMVSISSEMTVVSASLSHIQTLILSKQDSESLLRSRPEIAATLDTALTGCMVLFSCLDEEIKSVTKQPRRISTFSWKGKIKVAWKHETFQELLDGIRGQQLAISTLIQLLQTDSLSEITKLLQSKAPDLQKTVERTRSLRLSHPKINVALSLYSQEDRSSLYAVIDYLQTPSELDFDFDDIVVNSTAYRRVLAAAGRPVSTAKQDDSERLTAFAEVSDDVASFRKNLEASHDRLMRDRDIEDRTGSSCYGGDTGSLSIDHMEDAVAACEPRLIAEETPAEAEKLDFERLSEEKMAEFDQMVLELEAEKRQRIAEYAARQSELDRIKEEHERDMERTQQAREEFERQRKESEQRIQELLEAQAMTEPARAGGDVRTIDKMQNQTEPVVI